MDLHFLLEVNIILPLVFKKLRWSCCCSYGSSSPAAIPSPVERTRPEDQSGVGGGVGDRATDLLFWLQLMTGSGLALPKDTFFFFSLPRGGFSGLSSVPKLLL